MKKRLAFLIIIAPLFIMSCSTSKTKCDAYGEVKSKKEKHST